jgi:hypothetical protein
VLTFLTPQDVIRLTGRRKYKAQQKKLRQLGIRFQPAANGEPLILKEWLDEGGKAARNRGPRWDLVNA